jgi:hypothetical protein
VVGLMADCLQASGTALQCTLGQVNDPAFATFLHDPTSTALCSI